MYTMRLLPSVAIQPNLELKTRPKQLLGSLLLVIALPEQSCLCCAAQGNQAMYGGVIAWHNGRAHFKKCKQLFEYQHLLLLGDIWWSKL
jgi:hypothetical protein